MLFSSTDQAAFEACTLCHHKTWKFKTLFKVGKKVVYFIQSIVIKAQVHLHENITENVH